MLFRTCLATVAMLCVCVGARAEELSPEVAKSVDRGLAWLAKNQSPDGHWEANGGNYPTSMTALAGMALLMEGSTINHGKYSDNIRKAVDWFLQRSQRNGLLGNPNNPTESARYIYGHGYGILFLSQVYGEEEDAQRRDKLEKLLTEAVKFTGKAQTQRGGWGYVSAADGNNFDEGSTTITQLQALRAARNAGIPVPKSVIDNAQKYLREATAQDGGVVYSLAHGRALGGGRPALTAAAIAGGFSTGEYESEFIKKWFSFCRSKMPLDNSIRTGHDEYTHYYYAQSIYLLGDTGYLKLFPKAPESERLTWEKYKKARFNHLISGQSADGSWGTGHIGNVYTTAVNLAILQLDKASLPIYQR